VWPWDSHGAAAWSTNDAALATDVERARTTDQELTYLSLVPLLHGARHLDIQLSLGAHETLRNFARRLPGFASSRASYLFTNFLNVSATIQPAADRWIVRLASPPLHTVLAMTRAAQDCYIISWLNKRRVQLSTGEQ
jgi:hypothetical protein